MVAGDASAAMEASDASAATAKSAAASYGIGRNTPDAKDGSCGN
jgi:hypothetical protein